MIMVLTKENFKAILTNVGLTGEVKEILPDERVCLVLNNGALEHVKITPDGVKVVTLCGVAAHMSYALVTRSPVPAVTLLEPGVGVRFLIRTNSPRMVDLVIPTLDEEQFPNKDTQLYGIAATLESVTEPAFVLTYGDEAWFVENKSHRDLMPAVSFTLGDKPDVGTAVFSPVFSHWRGALNSSGFYASDCIKATIMRSPERCVFYAFLTSHVGNHGAPGPLLTINFDSNVFSFNTVFGQQSQTHSLFEGMDFKDWEPTML
jgi:hypothetical protein